MEIKKIFERQEILMKQWMADDGRRVVKIFYNSLFKIFVSSSCSRAAETQFVTSMKTFFSPTHRSNICECLTDGAARIFCDSSIFASPVTMQKHALKLVLVNFG